MKFYFNTKDKDRKPKCDTYWNEKTIRLIRIYPATPELDHEWLSNEHTNLWPVYECTDFSWNPMDCKDKDEAYKELCCTLNQSIYEYIMDI